MKYYEEEIKKYLEERKWDDLRPADLAKSISIESAELLELFQWTNQNADEIKKDKEKVELIKKELADVLIYCLDMSVLFEFDTGKVVMDKLEKIKQKYPAHLFKDRDKNTEPGTEDVYWKIKSEHRNKNNT